MSGDPDDCQSGSAPRRRLLHLGTLGVTTALAGCLGDLTGEETDSGDDDADTGDDAETDSDERIDVVDAYLEAAANSDTDRLSELSHELNPFDPVEWEAAGWEFQGGEDEAIPEYEAEVVEDATVSDVLALETADFWFHDVDLEADLGEADLALVEVEAVETAERGTWAVATEDGEWRVLFMEADDDTPDDPEDAFEEELLDEENDVVEMIDWEFDQDSEMGLEWAQVVLTDEPGIEAERVRIETAIEDSETEVYGPDGEPAGWSDSWWTVGLDPDGDQVIVTAIVDGEETAVHRETFDP